jgi:hypothetical protein
MVIQGGVGSFYRSLVRCNHVSDTGDGVEHFPDSLAWQSVILDLGHQYLEDLVNAAMKEDFKLVELRFTQRPCFCSPEEEVHCHWDGTE